VEYVMTDFLTLDGTPPFPSRCGFRSIPERNRRLAAKLRRDCVDVRIRREMSGGVSRFLVTVRRKRRADAESRPSSSGLHYRWMFGRRVSPTRRAYLISSLRGQTS